MRINIEQTRSLSAVLSRACAIKRRMALKAVIVGLLLACTYEPSVGQQVGDPAPDFAAANLEDALLRVTDFRGQVVIIDFWASWCGPCRKEMPVLIELYQEFQQSGLVILAVNIDERHENMQQFLKNLSTPVPFEVLVDPEQKIPPLYELEAMPTTVFVDKLGIVRYRHAGFREADKTLYKKELVELLGEEVLTGGAEQ